MRKKYLFVLLATSALLVFFWSGCKLDSPSDVHYTEYVLEIDSIIHPDTIRLGNSLPIKFYGTIGHDGCHSFSRFDGHFEGKTILITAYGRQSDETVCPSVEQYLQGLTLAVNQLDTGRYIIHVQQAYPPDLYDTVFVSGFGEVK